ncbi:hypothetical protein M011DRAFT_470116 [Sporormia fimetaria CBS 119925]|uniref:non-specific serine/threonine protein kinase n=1 Tax=Sporormia fimetaria CBS 119925 TaxID=1340428 RepID=A0A6A6V5M2_9PLEO|nr:hypothetical protein M011DRAFT_470116 [Sporormia fimetaria CBS 119925]
MSSARYANPSAASIPHQPAAYRPPPQANAPPGTFAPGTKVQVGKHRVTIEKYLSEGGFAHVYLVRVPKAAEHAQTPDVAVLKRVAVPDKEALANMKTEVETMKKLKGHKHIVTYIDSHASQLAGGGYEVFLLMEYCSGGGLIDFMNTRLQNRLKEPEILHIFSDVAEGVATMHYLRPPLLHRDLKVENVLITTIGGARIYKLCDFGSTAPPRPAATTAAEARLIEDDVQRHTTLQYRSPEMIDVYRKQPIDEKSDIWALGVLLYKLCYYTTPFEEVGQMAILNATYKFPSYPQFSDRLKRLIASMLRENPQQRPNIYQVVVEVCAMRHRSVPIRDIYSERTESQDRRNQQLPPAEPSVTSPPMIGLQKVVPVQKVQKIPEVTPMRRGRPTVPVQAPPGAKPSVSPRRGTAADPFAALDSQNVQVRSAAADELAARFPSLDEFSLLHDRGQKFEFSPSPNPQNDSQQGELNKRVTQALADEAFALPPDKAMPSSPKVPPAAPPKMAKPSQLKQSHPAQDLTRPTGLAIHQPVPQRPSAMVETSTQTSPDPSPNPNAIPDITKRPIWRVPDIRHHSRALSTPRSFDKQSPSMSSLRPDYTLPPRPSLLDRSKSHASTLTIPRSPASSRPSLEGQRPSAYDLGSSLDRSRSANSQPRPSSIHVESNLDYLRDRERERASSRTFASPNLSLGSPSAGFASPEIDTEDKNIASNVDFLRAMEHEDGSQKKHRSTSSQSKHHKRSSVSSITSNTKNIIRGKFGEAFRMFENNAPNSSTNARDEPRTPTSPLLSPTENSAKQLTPIAASEATSDPHSDDDQRFGDLGEETSLPPEVRRELERRRLSAEEKRVANAAKEYRRRLAEQGDAARGGKPVTGNRASSIQNRVRSLLDEGNKNTGVARTAEGYGKYTDTRDKALPPPPPPSVARKPDSMMSKTSMLAREVKTPNPNPDVKYSKPRPGPSASAPPLVNRPSTSMGLQGQGAARPNAPPKPMALRTGSRPSSSAGPQPQGAAPLRPGLGGLGLRNMPAGDGAEDADFDVASFSRRYPSLSGLEMVETEIPTAAGGGLPARVRDV